MKVKDLIIELQKMPQEAMVWHLWDGEPRTEINIVYESKEGDVVTADFSEVCYSTNSRPKDAPCSEKDRYWQTPKS
jgi:hypothetical protein